MALAPAQAPSLTSLPPEVLLHVLAYLEISDLLQTSRTCHLLQHLACDPLLHAARLQNASQTLSQLLARRPSKASISPPTSWIWLSRTNVLSRQISKSLIRIRLSHNLEHRPSPALLVERAILPSTCTSYSSPVSPALIQSQQAVQRNRLRDGLGRKLERRPSVGSLVSLNIIPAECVRRPARGNSGSGTTIVISPALVATRRNVIRESLKDGLRAWVEGRAIQEQKRKADEFDATERATVKNLVRKFAARRIASEGEVEGWPSKVTCTAYSGDSLERESRSTKTPMAQRGRWGREAELAKQRHEERRSRVGGDGGHYGACEQPTRARVLGLKKFWEGVIRAAAVG